MTPHEVVKNSLEKFEKEYDFINDEDEYTLDKYDVESFIEHLKSSQLSLLLSVKEMVEEMRKKESLHEHTYPIEIGVMTLDGYKKSISKGQKTIVTTHLTEDEITYNQAISDIQSILDSEINKIKEIWEE